MYVFQPFNTDVFKICRLKDHGVMVVEAGENQKTNITKNFPHIVIFMYTVFTFVFDIKQIYDLIGLKLA